VTDHELMTAVREGDLDSLGELFERHHRKLYNYFLKHTGDRTASEDMVQDLFLRLLKYRGSYRGVEDGFTFWLYRIARNVRFDHYGRKGPETPILDEELAAVTDDSPRPDALAESEGEAVLVRRALASLPDDRRELIIMSKFQEMPYRDIGLLLGCSEGTVKVRVFRAVRELAETYHQLTGEACHEL